MLDESTANNVPPGFSLRHTLRGHNEAIISIAWSPDGRVLASKSKDGIVRLWDMGTGQLRYTLETNFNDFSSIAWSPSGQTLASTTYEEFGEAVIQLWDTLTGELYETYHAYHDDSYSVASSPDWLAFSSVDHEDKTVQFWDLETTEPRLRLEGFSGWYFLAAWSPDGWSIAAASDEGTIQLWDAGTGLLRLRLEGHAGEVNNVAWSPDGQILASASDDRTVRIWDAVTGQLKIILEGHTSSVTSVSFSFDGSQLASKSMDGTVRLWRCDSWENVAMLDESTSGYEESGLAFHPWKAEVMATLGEGGTVIRVWDLNLDVIRSTSLVARGVSYANAKVVLVGETGVGKTGLGIRLAEGVWRPTPGSTHGMNVWPLYSEPNREIMLWDLAGQDEYRLVHQLFLTQTNVALMLYDTTKSDDTFFGIDYWERALRNTVTNEVQKILVAARVDVGGVRMTAVDIDGYCKAHDYTAHFATSAETNEGCDELRAAIIAAIPWERLPRTVSPEIFKRIKDFLTAIRVGNRILVREADLRAEFNAQVDADSAPTEDEFRTVIGHVETAGLIKHLSFGDFILLKPELLNAYASDIVDSARRHPDGLGAVRKAEVLDGRIPLKDEGGLKASDKIFLLHATVELFLRLGLALEQDGNLVFPSKFNQQMPPLEADPVVEVEFAFEGPVENIYTTLVVKLYYGSIFHLKKLWKNAAEFLNIRTHVCGFQLHSEGDGRGILKVFYAEGASDDDKALFLKIVADHFKEKRIAVRRERIYLCPHTGCRELVRDRNAVRRAIEKSIKEIPCQYCFKPIPLHDALETLYRDDKKFLAQIADMENRAEAGMERGSELVSASAELRTENFKTWSGSADIVTVAIVFTDVLNSTGLNVKLGDEPWRQVREAHFERARDLISQGHGYLIKTIGDSVMAAFHSAADALDFALALHNRTGHELIKIRAGIHIGPVEVSSDDAFGQQVSMAARVEAKAKDGGVWVSAQVKEDIDVLRASKHSSLIWTEHLDEEIKGFPQKCTLWSVEW
jgi:small GTP-binding protein